MDTKTKPVDPKSESDIEAKCIWQGKKLIDDALREMGIDASDRQYSVQDNAYSEFARTVAFDKYKTCIQRGAGR